MHRKRNSQKRRTLTHTHIPFFPREGASCSQQIVADVAQSTVMFGNQIGSEYDRLCVRVFACECVSVWSCACVRACVLACMAALAVFVQVQAVRCVSG